MSEVKRYDIGGMPDGGIDVQQFQDGYWVKYEDYADLKQRLDAVVAEGIALRKFIRDSCYVYNGDGSDISDAYGLAEESTLLPRQVETITTINSVRAEGVEILAVDLATPNPELADGTNKINKAMAWYARQFASKMRAADAAKDGV